jgi:Polyketide cyclase / dehydrase and lipid transport
MTRVEHSIEIARPIDEVFAFIAEPANDPIWLSSVLDVRADEGPIRAGTAFSETMRFLGRRVDVTWRVSEHGPPVRLAVEATSSPVPISGACQLKDLLEAGAERS